jgi:hypothetical protein
MLKVGATCQASDYLAKVLHAMLDKQERCKQIVKDDIHGLDVRLRVALDGGLDDDSDADGAQLELSSTLCVCMETDTMWHNTRTNSLCFLTLKAHLVCVKQNCDYLM